MVVVKKNIVDILRREVKKVRRGIVEIGTITDPYQTVEAIHNREPSILLLKHPILRRIHGEYLENTLNRQLYSPYKCIPIEEYQDMQTTIRPNFIVWVFTSMCNLNCKHCYTWRLRGLRELDLGEKLDLIKDLAEIGVGYVNLTGGEPLIHPHFTYILRELYDHGIMSSIVTNATRVSEDMARLLSKYNVYVYVSIDGPRKIHDMVRGIGTYDQVMKGIHRLRAHGVSFSIVMAVNSLNYNYVKEVIDIALKLGAECLALIPVMPSGKALSSRLYVRREEYLKALKTADEVADELGYNISLWCTPFAPLVVRSKYINYYYCRSYDVVDIDPAGRLLACDVIDIVISSIRPNGFKRAWKAYINNDIIRELVNPKKLPSSCSNCSLRQLCKSGCFARSYLVYGKLNTGDPLCPKVNLRL